VKDAVPTCIVLSIIALTLVSPLCPPAPAQQEPQRGGKLKALPRFDPKSQNPFQVDLREADLSSLDLRDRANDLAQAVFGTHTIWPPREKLPAGFDPQRILEAGKNPGLGVRSLHKRGITGRGVSIAVVDNPLLDSHREYAGRVRLHERINAPEDGDLHFHGCSVVSIAAGRTIGVAPEAEIYYISSWAFTGGQLDFTPRARAFERILEVNRGLAADKKIRAIVMAFGWAPSQRGAAEMDAAAKKAKDDGMLVVTPNIEQTHGSTLKFHGLADPDSFDSYEPGQFWANRFFVNGSTDRLLVPMDSRTTAGAGSDDEYFFMPQGGWSWAMPYLGGLYALAAQVDPKITPERFWELAMQTGRHVTLKREDRSYSLGPVADPVALIAALERH
jgi:subtilisin family serine protease